MCFGLSLACGGFRLRVNMWVRDAGQQPATSKQASLVSVFPFFAWCHFALGAGLAHSSSEIIHLRFTLAPYPRSSNTHPKPWNLSVPPFPPPLPEHQIRSCDSPPGGSAGLLAPLVDEGSVVRSSLRCLLLLCGFSPFKVRCRAVTAMGTAAAPWESHFPNQYWRHP